jgi:hypothetical protein
VVTLLTPPPFEVELDDEDDEPLLWALVEPVEPELEVVTVGFDATVVADDVVDVWLASAGSRPETSRSVIISQAATNSATAPEITRRRIVRARAARALRSAWPRARAAAALVSVIGRVPRVRCLGMLEACDQLRARPYQRREE